MKDKRIYKQDSQGTTTYFFDNYQGIEHVIIEYDEEGNMKARYTLGPRTDEIISKHYRDKHGNWKKMYYHYDGLGNVRVLTDEKGRIKGRYEYSPFGYPLIQQGKLTRYNNYTYTGRELDIDSKLYFYRTRYYNSRIGRFTSVDKLIRERKSIYPGFQVLQNKIRFQYSLLPPYQYVKNNPVNLKDPEGLYSIYIDEKSCSCYCKGLSDKEFFSKLKRFTNTACNWFSQSHLWLLYLQNNNFKFTPENSWDRRNFNTVKNNFTQLLQIISKSEYTCVMGIHIKCEKYQFLCVGADAMAYAGLRPGYIGLCPLFCNPARGESEQQSTILHEILHHGGASDNRKLPINTYKLQDPLIPWMVEKYQETF